MEFEDQEEEMGLTSSYDSNAAARVKMSGSGLMEVTGSTLALRKPSPRYKECLKNHAVGIGGHAIDGCGEFMPAGAEGTLDALKCAACNCHRNFHRKESEFGAAIPGHGDLYYRQAGPQFSPFFRAAPPSGYLHVSGQQRPLALPSPGGGGGGEDHFDDVSLLGSGRKRHRTKFTPEQKEKMFGLAEKLGWKVQKQDEEVIQSFCEETGVKRQVLKVWMHNNKHTLGKRNPN